MSEAQSYLDAVQWSFAVTGLLFVVAFGAICGSFINVLVYRLPRGLNVVSPPSACPSCGTRLTWRENFPVLGWLWLRGRCRFCRSKVSAEYPIVEAFTAGLFGLVFVMWFMSPSLLELVGVREGALRADFASDGLRLMWPMLVVVYALLGSLIAATLIDARTFTIPLALPWFATIVAVVVHPLHAWWVERAQGGLVRSAFAWTIPLPSAGMLGLALGGAAGIGLAVLLMRLRVLPQSFADYPEWEARALEAEKAAEAARLARGTPSGEDAAGNQSPPLKQLLLRTLFLTGPAVTLMLIGFAIGAERGLAAPLTTIGAATGLLIGLFLRRLAAPASAEPGGVDDEPVWTRYPHARREMAKELAFLTPAIVLGVLGWWLTRQAGPLGDAAFEAPLWLRALGGSLLGYLVGGGLVWAFRIGGSLVLGKEAMGLGDVHLMAAVGAAMGWIDPTLAFFVAPFMGIGWACLSVMFRQFFHTHGTALPYGPHLAAATVLIVLLKPLAEVVLSALMGRSINIP